MLQTSVVLDAPVMLAPGSIKVEPREAPAPFRPLCGNGRLKKLVDSLPTLTFDTEAEAESAIAAQLRDETCTYIPLTWNAGDIMTKLWLRKCVKIKDGKLTIQAPEGF